MESEHEAYVEAVLHIVEAIPPGRVMSYGSIAELVGRGGPRQVGQVMAAYGGGVPWWRVVRADGTLPKSHGRRAHEQYAMEATPMADQDRVDMPRARWAPPTVGGLC